MKEDLLNTNIDLALKEEAIKYAKDKNVTELFTILFDSVVRNKPKDVTQYMIDVLIHGEEEAQQDPITGLSKRRLAKAEQVFEYMNKGKNGEINLSKTVSYTKAGPKGPITEEDVKNIFNTMDADANGTVSKRDFFIFLGHLSQRLDDRSFDKLIHEMLI